MSTDREWRLIYRCEICKLEMILENDGTLPWHTEQKGGVWPKTVCPGVGSKEYTEVAARPVRRRYEPPPLEPRQRPEDEYAPNEEQD